MTTRQPVVEDPGIGARRLAYDALCRIAEKGAYANLVLSPMLDKSSLSDRDRRFATELVYGTTRMMAACDHLVERFLLREVDPQVRVLLRLGAYQLHFLETPAHAAVDATVEIAPKKVRGFVNAILRRVSDTKVDWPDDATRLSYPQWIIDRLTAEHGAADALAMLERMNVAPSVTERPDGYVQDLGSQWVVEATEAEPDHRVLDVCAAPGGKATALAATGATVIAGDRRTSRVGLVRSNAERLDSKTLQVVVADAVAAPFRPRSFDRVLVDAPCSGIGVLRRRADARWRLEPEAPTRLAELQIELLSEAATMVAPGGMLIYSVCTVTAEETTEVVEATPVVAAFAGEFEPLPNPDAERWRPWGSGVIVLPHDHDTDGMSMFRWRRR